MTRASVEYKYGRDYPYAGVNKHPRQGHTCRNVPGFPSHTCRCGRGDLDTEWNDWRRRYQSLHTPAATVSKHQINLSRGHTGITHKPTTMAAAVRFPRCAVNNEQVDSAILSFNSSHFQHRQCGDIGNHWPIIQMYDLPSLAAHSQEPLLTC